MNQCTQVDAAIDDVFEREIHVSDAIWGGDFGMPFLECGDLEWCELMLHMRRYQGRNLGNRR